MSISSAILKLEINLSSGVPVGGTSPDGETVYKLITYDPFLRQH